MTIEVKICGLTTSDAVELAASGGARYLGFVFFPPSPRFVTPAQARELAADIPEGIIKVGLLVDADDSVLEGLLAEAPLDLLQFHGSELPDRIAAVRARFGLPVMKALALAGPEDLKNARVYEEVADRMLFDAVPPAGATRPGGNALAFDWKLLSGQTWRIPWILAGGLNPENVAEAIRMSGARAVDVSSGVEDAPGFKNPAQI